MEFGPKWHHHYSPSCFDPTNSFRSVPISQGKVLSQWAWQKLLGNHRNISSLQTLATFSKMQWEASFQCYFWHHSPAFLHSLLKGGPLRLDPAVTISNLLLCNTVCTPHPGAVAATRCLIAVQLARLGQAWQSYSWMTYNVCNLARIFPGRGCKREGRRESW